MKLNCLHVVIHAAAALGWCAGTANAQATLDWVSSQRGGGNSVLADADGFVYVSSGVDLVKFDVQGNVIWSRRLDPRSISIARWITFDPAGDIVLTGGTSADNYRFLTMKYDPDGNRVWETKTTSGSFAFRVATDARGNSYVLGRTPAATELAIAKYDPNGNELWFRTYFSGSTNRAYNLAVSAAGEAAITGESAVNDFDMVTVVYETDGTLRWARNHSSSISGGGRDHGNSVAFGSAGEVYTGGLSENAPFDWDFTLVKYDAAGHEQWVRDYDSPGPGFDSVDRVAVDSQGNIVVAGYLDFDLGIIKYDPQGNLIWMDRFGSAGEEFLSEMVISTDDSIYLTGQSSQEILTAKYDANGTLRWSTRYDITSRFSERGYGIALDSEKGIVVAATYPALAVRYVEDQTWTGLGNGLPGGAGIPVLTGQGSLTAGQPVTLQMSQSSPSSPYMLIIGLSQLNVPLFGGTLVPSPDSILTGLTSDANGWSTLTSTWPSGIAPGTDFWFQTWILDSAGPRGVSASNGLRGQAQ